MSRTPDLCSSTSHCAAFGRTRPVLVISRIAFACVDVPSDRGAIQRPQFRFDGTDIRRPARVSCPRPLFGMSAQRVGLPSVTLSNGGSARSAADQGAAPTS
jgi:hypothetical protein